MTSATTNDIRTAFLDFFAANGHALVPSGPLVPANDPTLLFTNAGMVQFKNVFTGVEKRDYVRATTSQKCVRAGGKHNDLDNVGYTARHHTFFEMLGNFSFGDYFKELAIELAWHLVARDFALSKDRLWVTVYHTDDEAHDIWRKVSGLPAERILRIATSDNFWAMGETGPCGPCSEIFYDHGPGIAGGPPGSGEAEGDRYVEIWNLVFMQHEQLPGGARVDLPRPSIDTGMGLERIAAVLQGKHDNYDIDLFEKLIGVIAEVAGSDPEDPAQLPSHRVIADHLRASAFLLADGVMPSNEGRGYVLRRIMRRAMRHAQLMGVGEPLMWRLVPALVAEMGQAFPELARAQALIGETLKLEETRFHETLARGLRLLADETAKLSPGAPLPGEVAFKLYDTYGFPLDLTQDALRAEGRDVELAGFEAAMARQRADARASWAGSGEAATEQVWFELREQVGATEFLGYQADEAEAQVVALVVDGKPVDSAAAGQKIALLTNQTPFYAEAGGQVGDTGTASDGAHMRIQIEDTVKRLDALHVHIGTVLEGEVRTGEIVHLAIDARRRAALRRNHSATHLLHAALRRHLGDHVTQKGSLVAPDRLRFDISHPKPVSDDELGAIEREVNAEILANTPVQTLLMTPSEAVEAGALALFGEKYGAEVRVLRMGGAPQAPYSVELCGGTHVARTGDIGLFKVVGEGAVAAGVRRIEAVTGEGALAYVNAQAAALREAAAVLRTQPAELPARIAQLLEERKRLERELTEARRALATGGAGAGAETRRIAGVAFAARKLDGVPAKELRGMADAMKKQLGSGVVMVVSATDGKGAAVVGVTDDLTGRIDAVDLVRAAAQALGGKGGGGRPDMAQAGGPDGAGADAAIAAVEAALAARAEAA